MLQLLYPGWMLALPLCGLPWFWPVIQPPRGEPLPFSTLFLFPRENLSRHFQWSSREWPLKLLRSLMILLLVLLFAKPYFGTLEPHREVRILDDTPSAGLHLKAATENILDWENTFQISELLPQDPLEPISFQQDFPGYAAGSPSLATLASVLMDRFPEESRLKLTLVSDFQHTQYWFYPAAVQPVNWSFERPEGLQSSPNLAMRNPKIKTEGLFEPRLFFKVYGNMKATGDLRITVLQQDRKVGETRIQWEGETIPVSLSLSDQFRRLQPVKILLETELPQAGFDDLLYFQESSLNDLWVGIMTSEGPEGMFRHGLHALKSALNASETFSFLVRDLEHLKDHVPDVLILLGDHPLRWKALKDGPPALFIPTRLGDWKEYARQYPRSEGSETQDNQSLWPQGQWLVDWTQAPFAEDWQIRRNEFGNFESETRGIVLLETGISDPWGSLYRIDEFAERLQGWLQQLEKRMHSRRLGSFYSGTRKLNSAIGYSRLGSGNYQTPENSSSKTNSSSNSKRTKSFSVNLPPFESEMRLMSDEELQRMQTFFDQRQPPLQQTELGSAEKIKQWLLWIVLLIALAEISMILLRRNPDNPA